MAIFRLLLDLETGVVIVVISERRWKVLFLAKQEKKVAFLTDSQNQTILVGPLR